MVKCGADVRMFERIKCGHVEVKDDRGSVRVRASVINV